MASFPHVAIISRQHFSSSIPARGDRKSGTRFECLRPCGTFQNRNICCRFLLPSRAQSHFKTRSRLCFRFLLYQRIQTASLGIRPCHRPSWATKSWENESKYILHISARHSPTNFTRHVDQSSLIDCVSWVGGRAREIESIPDHRHGTCHPGVRHPGTDPSFRLSPNFLFLLSGPLLSERINKCFQEAFSGPELTRNVGHTDLFYTPNISPPRSTWPSWLADEVKRSLTSELPFPNNFLDERP